MSDRIDHAAEARRILDGADALQSVQQISAAAAAAQVHATLALAEQQRIANLIAWTTANGSEPTEWSSEEINKGLDL